MNVSNAAKALQWSENQFNINKTDASPKAFGKLLLGTATKIGTLNLAAAEFGLSKAGSVIFRNRAEALSNRSTDAAETFTKAASSLNRPFVTEQVKTGNWLFSKTKTIEGPTISGILHSGIQQANDASTTKKAFAGATLLAVTAVAVYFLRSEPAVYFLRSEPFEYFIAETRKIEKAADSLQAYDFHAPTHRMNFELSTLKSVFHNFAQNFVRKQNELSKIATQAADLEDQVYLADLSPEQVNVIIDRLEQAVISQTPTMLTAAAKIWNWMPSWPEFAESGDWKALGRSYLKVLSHL